MTKQNFFSKNSTQLTIKLFLIGILVLLLLIPKLLIMDLVYEREGLKDSVIQEVSNSWANEQLITGPILVVPYTMYDDSTKRISTHHLTMFPDKMQITGDIATQKKHRSIYEVLLYDSQLELNGSFKMPNFEGTTVHTQNLKWEEAFITLNISDLKGIQHEVDLEWDDQKLVTHGGTNGMQFSNSSLVGGAKNNTSGLYAKLHIKSDTVQHSFKMGLSLKGSKSIAFSPIALSTHVTMKSAFPDPSFYGKFLPTSTLDQSGFTADWNVLEFNRNLPSFIADTKWIDLEDNVFGVKLESSVDNYVKTNRATKYMILIVVLTFLVVFITEIMEKLKIHPFQYTLIGLAISIFFTLLLALSEYISFDLSYLSSSAAVAVLLFLYSLTMFKSKKSTWILFLLLVFIFGYIYVIIQLEKTALLFGAIGLFVILGATMYVTRSIKWYESTTEEAEIAS